MPAEHCAGEEQEPSPGLPQGSFGPRADHGPRPGPTDRAWHHWLGRGVVRLWTLPNTLLGLVCLPLALATGGGAQWVRGVCEIYGGAVTWLLRRVVPLQGGARALTLGHVILGRDRRALALCREHEHVHVRQYERWGPLFIPLYLGWSVWLGLRGRSAYLDNPFEREAYDAVPELLAEDERWLA